MPDIIDLISHWWKRIFAVVIIALFVVGVITFLKPRKYLSVATAVPASSFASDRSRIFNENIDALYSTLGTADDLDMIVGTASLDTVYWAVAQQFNLQDHYKFNEEGDAAVSKAAVLLKKNTKVQKSEYGELKVRVWDTDKNLAAELANTIMDVLNNIHSELQSQGNRSVLNSLMEAKQRTRKEVDSVKTYLRNADIMYEDTGFLNTRYRLLSEYEKKIAEYQLMVNNKPPVLIAVERAKPSNWPDKPRRLQIMIATAILSFLFALLAALVFERRKNNSETTAD
jgi:uncharacterized protein involved in exopolysaccharide biosynthesis